MGGGEASVGVATLAVGPIYYYAALSGSGGPAGRVYDVYASAHVRALYSPVGPQAAPQGAWGRIGLL